MNYSAAVLERVRDPKHVGWMARDAPDVGTGEAGTLERGTVTRIQMRIDETAARVDAAVFKVFGCSAAIASASLVAERLHGADFGSVRALEPLQIVAELQLPIERAHVAALAVEAAQAALKDWEQKRQGTRNQE